ncbi:hypothetical protein DFQ28_000986 [Apophysomyces sp. BC1034]|nr:hypothetical protein DFQ30_004698 [Apophysomyces sp. BC1015]KAG0177916.1 hypothetical protein DFQ29_004180 [Apophysomyces sp. BC1021]KAG0191088.1 hypothetical protein DFQ28_000986 [Apophysomyces sp. BC1034]
MDLVALRTRMVKVDQDGLPVAPTWSVNSLLEPVAGDQHAISDKQLDHLFKLAQLRPPLDNVAREALKRDVKQLSQFTRHIQVEDFGDVKPLIHIWRDDIGLCLRKDQPGDDVSNEPRGRELLAKAKEKSGNFYVVHDKLPSMD